MAPVHAVHVGGKPRIEHDRMILNHRHDHDSERPEPDFPLAIARDEEIGRPRYPESIRQVVSTRVLRYEKCNLQFEIYFSRRTPK